VRRPFPTRSASSRQPCRRAVQGARYRRELRERAPPGSGGVSAQHEALPRRADALPATFRRGFGSLLLFGSAIRKEEGEMPKGHKPTSYLSPDRIDSHSRADCDRSQWSKALMAPLSGRRRRLGSPRASRSHGSHWPCLAALRPSGRRKRARRSASWPVARGRRRRRR
jgi:hypothetical protein